jgi:hypothetical protein
MSVNYRLVSLNLQSTISPDENPEKVRRFFRASFLSFIKFEAAAFKRTNVIKKTGCL